MRRKAEDNLQHSELIEENDIVEDNEDINEIQGRSYGDCIETQPKSEVLRIEFRNVNRLAAFNKHETNENLSKAIN